MIVRALFSVLVTVGLLVGAVVWHGAELESVPEERAEGPGTSPVDAQDAGERSAAVELSAVAEEVAPVLEQVAEVAEAVARVTRTPDPERETDSADVIEDSEQGVRSVSGEAPVAQEEPAPPETWADAIAQSDEFSESEAVPETVIVPYEERPFVEGAPTDDADAYANVDAEEGVAVAAVRPDQEEWAGLIRRMLDIYERVGDE